jgi:hypothetical protein
MSQSTVMNPCSTSVEYSSNRVKLISKPTYQSSVHYGALLNKLICVHMNSHRKFIVHRQSPDTPHDVTSKNVIFFKVISLPFP